MLASDIFKTFAVDQRIGHMTEFYLAGCVYRIDASCAEDVYVMLRAALIDGNATLLDITTAVELLGAQRVG